MSKAVPSFCGIRSAVIRVASSDRRPIRITTTTIITTTTREAGKDFGQTRMRGALLFRHPFLPSWSDIKGGISRHDNLWQNTMSKRIYLCMYLYLPTYLHYIRQLQTGYKSMGTDFYQFKRFWEQQRRRRFEGAQPASQPQHQHMNGMICKWLHSEWVAEFLWWMNNNNNNHSYRHVHCIAFKVESPMLTRMNRRRWRLLENSAARMCALLQQQCVYVHLREFIGRSATMRNASPPSTACGGQRAGRFSLFICSEGNGGKATMLLIPRSQIVRRLNNQPSNGNIFRQS